MCAAPGPHADALDVSGDRVREALARHARGLEDRPQVLEHLLDLGGEIALVLHADGLEVELVCVFGGVRLGARLHLLEELVGERLHDQADFGLVGRISEGRAPGEDRRRSGRVVGRPRAGVP